MAPAPGRRLGRATGTRPDRVRTFLSGALVVALLTLVGATALGAPSRASAQVTAAEFPTADVAPEDALAYLVFTLDQESEQWALGAELLERAGFGDALADLRDEVLTDEAGNELPLDAFLGGEIAVVVTDEVLSAAAGVADAGLIGGAVDATPVPADAEPAATGAALVLAARSPDTAFAGIRGSLEDQAAEEGAEVLETDYEGVTIDYAVGGGEEGGTSMAVARVDDHILLAAAPADLEPMIDTSQGTIAPLAEFTPFVDVRASLDEDYLLYGFFNGVAAGDAQAALADTLGPAASGLGGTDRYSGLLIRADDPGFRMETVATPAEGSPLPPAAPNFESELVTQTPGDALFFLSAFDLGATGVLDALGAGLIALAVGEVGVTGTPTPDQTAEELIAAQYEQAAALLGFNLQTDLFRQFTGEYGLWIASDPDPASITALFASGVADPGTVVNALRQLTLLVQGGGGGVTTVTTRDVEGAEVNVVDTGDPALPDVEYGVVGGRFLLAVGDAIDAAVEGPSETLADNPQFREVMATLPAERNGTLYVDLAQIVPLLQGLAEATAQDEVEIEDASEDCAAYDTQADAQAAYDAGDEGTFDLDQDFDGEVCEDFFAAATPEAAAAPPADAVAAVAEADYSAIRAFALAAFDEDGDRRSSSILYIAEAGDEAEATPVP
jgi:hypothetical protein